MCRSAVPYGIGKGFLKCPHKNGIDSQSVILFYIAGFNNNMYARYFFKYFFELIHRIYTSEKRFFNISDSMQRFACFR